MSAQGSKTGGSIRVYSSALHEELLDAAVRDPRDLLTPEEKEKEDRRRLGLRKKKLTEAEAKAHAVAVRAKKKKQLRLKRFMRQTQRMQAKMKSNLKKQVAINEQRRERRFMDMLYRLAEEQRLINEIENYLVLKEQTDHRRKEQLYKRWVRDVFRPIKHQIQKQLENISTSQIELKRRALFEAFLAEANSKMDNGLGWNGGGLDAHAAVNETQTIAYEAVAAMPKLGYSQKNLVDPMKRDLATSAYERAIIAELDPQKNILESSSRVVLDPKLWGTLEATPHGRYSEMFGGAAARAERIRQAEAAAKAAGANPPRRSNQSSVKFDHYTFSQDPSVCTKEYFGARGLKKLLPPSEQRRLAQEAVQAERSARAGAAAAEAPAATASEQVVVPTTTTEES